jgi:hypothetical protein
MDAPEPPVRSLDLIILVKPELVLLVVGNFPVVLNQLVVVVVFVESKV